MDCVYLARKVIHKTKQINNHVMHVKQIHINPELVNQIVLIVQMQHLIFMDDYQQQLVHHVKHVIKI